MWRSCDGSRRDRDSVRRIDIATLRLKLIIFSLAKNEIEKTHKVEKTTKYAFYLSSDRSRVLSFDSARDSRLRDSALLGLSLDSPRVLVRSILIALPPAF